MDTENIGGVEDILRELHNAANIIARVRDPPLISRDYLWTIVELAKKVKDIDQLLSELLSGRKEFMGILREEVSDLSKVASLVYKAYRDRIKLLTFTILAPLVIAGLDLLVLGFNGWFGVLVLLLGGLVAISLPLSYVLYALFLVILSLSSMMYACLYYRDLTTILAVLLYSMLGTITGLTTYYAGRVKVRLQEIIEEILRSSAPPTTSVPVKEEAVLEEINVIWNKLREKYRQLYGSDGEEILEYRLALLLRAGYSRERAIRMLADELKISDKNNLEEK